MPPQPGGKRAEKARTYARFVGKKENIISHIKKCFIELSFTDDFNSQILHENTKKGLSMDNIFTNGVDP